MHSIDGDDDATVRRTATTRLWKWYTNYHLKDMPEDAGPETIDWNRFIEFHLDRGNAPLDEALGLGPDIVTTGEDSL